MGPAPTVTIHVYGQLHTYCAGAAQLSISAHTVRAALEDLARSQSALYRNLLIWERLANTPPNGMVRLEATQGAAYSIKE